MVKKRLDEKRRKGEMFTMEEIEILENKLNDLEFQLHQNAEKVEVKAE